MNILVAAAHGLYQNYTSSFVHNQAKAYVQMGHRVRAVVPVAFGKRNDEGKRFGRILDFRNVDGVEICYLRYLSLGRFGANRFNRESAMVAIRCLMRRILHDFAPDVIHGHALDFGSQAGFCFREHCGAPLVVTTHGGDTNTPFEKGQYDWLKSSCDRADAVVAVSNKVRSRLEMCGTHTPICTIYNGFIQHPYPAACEKATNSLIQVGNLIPSKRVDVTIRAFAKLLENNPQMELTIIGQGPLRGELEALCDQLGVSASVHFLGQLPNAEVFHQMCRSGIFVMASKPEGFGIVYLEAMAAGCVVVGTEGEGIADIVENGKNGFLVPADDVSAVCDVIGICLADPQRADAIAEQGRKTAREMTWEHNALQYQSLFESLLGQGNEDN